MPQFSTGAEAIEYERARQFDVEGYDPGSDDSYTAGELLAAAKAYIDVNERLDIEIPGRIAALEAAVKGLHWKEQKLVGDLLEVLHNDPLSIIKAPEGWPWHQDAFKPSLDRQRNLEKAGALIAAEWDRLQRAKPAAS